MKLLTPRGVLIEEQGRTCMIDDIDGFSLHAAVRFGADDRQALEQLELELRTAKNPAEPQALRGFLVS